MRSFKHFNLIDTSAKSNDLECRMREKWLTGTRTSATGSILRVKCDLESLSCITLTFGSLFSLYIVSRASITYLHLLLIHCNAIPWENQWVVTTWIILTVVMLSVSWSCWRTAAFTEQYLKSF